MNNIMTAAVAVSALCLLSSAVSGEEQAPTVPTYTSDGGLKLPEHYREWVYLSTGFDMSYRPTMQAGHHMFDNVFVNPESYRWFLKTGTWPDKTMLVLEERRARGRGSINRTGNYQDQEVMGLEVHLRMRRYATDWSSSLSRAMRSSSCFLARRNAIRVMPRTRLSIQRSFSSIRPCCHSRPARGLCHPRI
jgi:hypothetical protein